jgi:hypothetical protein
MYSSPQVVYEAFRRAAARQEYRVAFLSLTPGFQEREVFESFMVCMDSGLPAVRALLRKYHVDSEALMAAYADRYQQKHGTDILKLRLDYAQKRFKAQEEYLRQHPEARAAGGGIAIPSAKLGPPPPEDEELIYRSVVAVIADKVGFYEEVNQTIALDPDTLPRFGDLEGLNVEGETATANACVTSFVLHSGRGGPLEKDAETRDKIVRFRLLDGSWLIDWIGFPGDEPVY